MAKAGEAGVEKKQSPSRRKIWIFNSAAANTPDEINEADYSGGIEWYAEERVRKAAMVREGESWTSEAAEDVEVGGFSGEREREGGQSGLAVEAGASQACAGQEVGDRFQAGRRIVGDALVNANPCEIYFVGEISVSALGTTVISAGNVPRSSPSAST